MIRFAWLQARSQTAVVGAGLAVVAILAAITGPHLGHLYATTVAECRLQQNCVGGINPFSNADYNLYGILGMLVLVLPGIVGVFWGAPLVSRELESGTYRLAWTQGVGRRRWLASRLAVVGLASVAATGAMSLAVSWAARSIDLTKADQFRYFDQRDVVPVGYAAFGLALGVVIGLLVRRVLPALATTLVAFVLSRYAVERGLRPHLVGVSHSASSLRGASGLGFALQPGGASVSLDAPHIPNAYVLSAQLVDKAGHPVSGPALHRFLLQNCPSMAISQAPLGPGAANTATPGPAGPAVFNACVDRLSSVYHQSVTYIGPSRYWTMQWKEMCLFLVGAVVLAAVGVWMIKRTPS